MNVKNPGWCRGFALLRWIMAIPFVLIGLVVVAFGYCEARKAYWDNKVRQMCAKDGGVKVFETIQLNEREIELLKNKFGNLDIPSVEYATKDAPLIHKDSYTYIRRGDPEVWKYEFLVIRQADQKVLAARVSYSRVGGDFPSIIGHPTYFRCPDNVVNIFSELLRHAKEQK